MNKLPIIRFLAFCASLSFLACSDDSSQTREEICAKGVSVGCLAGTWNFRQVEDSDLATYGYQSASGTLTLDKDGGYKFNGRVTGEQLKNHEGDWSISDDGKSMRIECKKGDLSGVLDGTYPITLNPNSILKISGIGAGNQKFTPFSDYQADMYNRPNPIEKYEFAP